MNMRTTVGVSVAVLGVLVIALDTRAGSFVNRDPNVRPAVHDPNIKLSDTPVQANRPRLPLPTIQISQAPYNDTQAHPISIDSLSSETIEKVVAPVASRWAHPGPFEVNSLWQITPNLQMFTGWFTEVGAPAVIELPSTGEAKYVPLLKSGGGGPATIKGVKGDWVLIQQGNGYEVFNYLTGDVATSDEGANPGKVAKLFQ